MTEKRFKEIISIETIIDNKTGLYYKPVVLTDDFLEVVNELHEENEQLKKANEKLESLWEDKCIKDYMKFVGENALQEMHNEKYGDK